MRGGRLAVIALLALLPLAGCGGPDELSREQGQRIELARERLDDAIDTHETLRTSNAEARRLISRVRAIVSRGEFESEPLDEFGLASLGELQMLVGSLVITDRAGIARRLDRGALRTFLRFAAGDPRRALSGPVRRQVGVVERTIEDAGADAGTRVPGLGMPGKGDPTADELLRALERDLRPAFPSGAKRLRATREGL